MIKRCPKCGGEKTGAHAGYCIACYNAYKREWYQRNREKEVARSMAYNQANYGRFLDNLKRYRAKPETRARVNRWCRKNRKQVGVYDATKHARRKVAMGGLRISRAAWDALKELHGNCCAYCRQPALLTKDHRVPLSRGGRHIIENILPACRPCNSRKFNRTEEEFRANESRNPAHEPHPPGRRVEARRETIPEHGGGVMGR